MATVFRLHAKEKRRFLEDLAQDVKDSARLKIAEQVLVQTSMGVPKDPLYYALFCNFLMSDAGKNLEDFKKAYRNLMLEYYRECKEQKDCFLRMERLQ